MEFSADNRVWSCMRGKGGKGAKEGSAEQQGDAVEDRWQQAEAPWTCCETAGYYHHCAILTALNCKHSANTSPALEFMHCKCFIFKQSLSDFVARVLSDRCRPTLHI